MSDTKFTDSISIKLNIDTEEFQELVALCLEQVKLINDLHGQVYDNSELDGRVETMFCNIREMKLDGYLNKIKADAVREAKSYLLGNGFTYGAPYKLDELISKLERGEV